ncbi:MAG: glycosyltransferase [Rhodospirillaceae bacterium]|nr:glycosyltransferase [Rhodospirillales bacterium]
MHITLVDDSIPFDGFTASARAMGGAEKAFAALPGALARRGHSVAVFNRCRWSMFIEGAQWETFDGRKPLTTDVLVAFRKPALLEYVRQAKRRVLWTTQPARVLDRKATRIMLDDMKPLVLLCSAAQTEGWSPGGLAVGALPPAVKSDYLNDAATAPAIPPRAIVTTHPAHGLDWLLELWLSRIHPAAPEAELHIYSIALSKAADGGAVAPELQMLAAKVLAARDHGIVILRPGSDGVMAQAYREARVHLYPGHADDTTAFTLMESQATGLPAVLRPLGAAPERVGNGQSAYVVPDDEAFANLASTLLTNEAVAQSMGSEAKALYTGRSWDAAAERFEALLT